MFVTAVWSLVELTNKKFGIKLRLGFSFPYLDTPEGRQACLTVPPLLKGTSHLISLRTDRSDVLTGEVTTAEPIGPPRALPELVMPSLSESSVSHGLHFLTLLSDLASEPEIDADPVQSTVSKKGVMRVR